MYSSYFFSSPQQDSLTYQILADPATTGAPLLENAAQPPAPPLYMDFTALPMYSTTTLSVPAPSLCVASTPFQVTPPLYLSLTSPQTSFDSAPIPASSSISAYNSPFAPPEASPTSALSNTLPAAPHRDTNPVPTDGLTNLVATESSFSGTLDTSIPPPNTEQRYIGERQVSKYGKHDVLIYRIPGTTESLTFYKAYAIKNGGSYACVHCLKERRRRGKRLAGGFIRVMGDEFLTDPCGIEHECSAAKYSEERGNRHVYKEMQNIRRDPRCAERKPVRVYLDMVAAPFDAENEDMEDSIRAAVRRSGYQERRRVISKNIGVWANRSVTMDHVPLEFRTLRDGSTFLQHHAPGFHIYYSVATIQMACEAGLHSVVADGMHSLHPKTLGYQAQLYCVHGVCSTGVEVPLLYCITASKTGKFYTKIFDHLKANIDTDAPKRVILDFERAAIRAARKVFPSASVEGCAFHLAQAWNRKRDALGLRRYTQGLERDERVAEWWDTIKGVVFLPRPLLSLVRALQTPPVPRDHSAHGKCEEFINYFRVTWMQGPYKDMWCKWKLEELRTTNLAEAFHRRLGLLVGVDHPPLSVLIETLRKLNYEARAALKRLREDPEHARVLQKRDEERRAKIAEEMSVFEECCQNGASQEEIERFCSRMSRYVTNTSV